MAIWKEQTYAKKEAAPLPLDPSPKRDTAPHPEPAPSYDLPRRPASSERETKESLIASDLTIEGKIEGSGHVRIAGRFKGEVNVQGNLTIEKGAHLTGGVRADRVSISGELDGNIEAASRVELLESGVLTGDLQAGSLTVAAGSRMRGRVEFGWGNEEKSRPKIVKTAEGSTAP